MNRKSLTHNCLFLISLFSFLLLVFSCSSPKDEITRYSENGKRYFEEKEFEKAKIEFLNVIKLDPENDAAHYDLGETYVHLQDPVKAAAAFTHSVAINPSNLKAQLRLGQILLLAKETKQARDTANAILMKHPDNLEAMHLLSTIQIQERNLPLAIKTLKKAISTAPSDHRAYLFLAHLLYVTDRFAEAEPYYLKTIELDNTLRAPYMELAALYRKKGEINKIEPLIREWVKIPGNRIQKSNDLARFQESQGQIEAAERTLLEASVNAPDDPQAIVNLGDFYARQKQNKKALDLFVRAQSFDKKNINIRAKTATLLFEQKNDTEAESAVDAILAKDDRHEQANFLKGCLAFNKNDIVSALKYFEIVIGENTNHARARYFKARCLMDNGTANLPGQDLFRVAEGYTTAESWEKKLARDELLRAVEIDPGFVNARLLLAQIYLDENNAKSARLHLASLLRKEPQNLQALLLAGKLKLLDKDLAGAEKIYRSILERHPDFAAGHVSLGLALHRMEKDKAALSTFDKALEINPNQMDALNYKVNIYMQAKDVEQALEACQEHRQKDQLTTRSLAIIDLIQGKILMTTGHLDKAAVLFEKAIEQEPALLAPYENLGIINEYQKDIPRAVGNYEKLLALKPDYLPTYLSLSRIYKDQGELSKAKAYLKTALSIKDDFAPAANNLAFMLAEANSSLYEALRLAKTARDKEPKNPDYLDTLGWIYYLQGSIALALQELKTSIAINPDNPLAHYHLGWTFYEEQNYEAARSHMAKALALDPGFSGADKARDILGQ